MDVAPDRITFARATVSGSDACLMNAAAGCIAHA
jgi:hypothetical protein